jgi:hypothetical protein
MIDLQQRLAKYETVTSITATNPAVFTHPASARAHYKHASAATNGSSSTAVAAVAVSSSQTLHSSSSSSSINGGSRSDVLASLNSRYSTYCYNTLILLSSFITNELSTRCSRVFKAYDSCAIVYAHVLCHERSGSHTALF